MLITNPALLATLRPGNRSRDSCDPIGVVPHRHGLDSEIVASFCESFATHVDLPKEKWFKYHPPIEVKVAAPIKVEEKTITYNDPIVPTSYVEKPPFPVRIKDHAKASTVVRKKQY